MKTKKLRKASVIENRWVNSNNNNNNCGNSNISVLRQLKAKDQEEAAEAAAAEAAALEPIKTKSKTLKKKFPFGGRRGKKATKQSRLLKERTNLLKDRELLKVSAAKALCVFSYWGLLLCLLCAVMTTLF